MPGAISVLLAAPEEAAQDLLEKLLAEFNQVTAFDGRRMAKRAWGFLGEKLSAEDADRLQKAAAAQGLQTIAVEEKDISLPAATNLRRARLDDAALHYTVGTDETERSLAWDQIALLTAVGLREETSFTKTVHTGPTPEQRLMSAGIAMATGIPISIGGKGEDVKKVMKTAEFYLYLDLFTKDNVRLNVDAQRFIFKDLGDKMQPTAPANFRVLLDELLRRLPAALTNRAVRMIKQGQTYASMGYENHADYEKECRWLLTLCRKTA